MWVRNYWEQDGFGQKGTVSIHPYKSSFSTVGDRLKSLTLDKNLKHKTIRRTLFSAKSLLGFTKNDQSTINVYNIIAMAFMKTYLFSNVFCVCRSAIIIYPNHESIQIPKKRKKENTSNWIAHIRCNIQHLMNRVFVHSRKYKSHIYHVYMLQCAYPN